MSIIAIISSNHNESKKIMETLSQLEAPDYRFEFELIKPSQVGEKLGNGENLVVYNNNNIDLNTIQEVTCWRKKGCESTVLILAKTYDDKIVDSLEPDSKIVILEKPFADRDLCGVVNRLLVSEKAYQRKHRRFEAAQSISVSSYKSSFTTKASVTNMSKGGLCLSGPIEGLKVGDLLRIEFALDEINSRRVVSGKVVWLATEEGVQHAGVLFMKESEIYSQLLDKIG